MLTIEDKPDRPVCATHGVLKWGYFTDTKQGARWVSWTYETVAGFGPVLVPHVCDDPDRTVRWQPDPKIAERAHRGAALASSILAGEDPDAATQKLNEKEEHRG